MRLWGGRGVLGLRGRGVPRAGHVAPAPWQQLFGIKGRLAIYAGHVARGPRGMPFIVERDLHRPGWQLDEERPSPAPSAKDQALGRQWLAQEAKMRREGRRRR